MNENTLSVEEVIEIKKRLSEIYEIITEWNNLDSAISEFGSTCYKIGEDLSTAITTLKDNFSYDSGHGSSKKYNIPADNYMLSDIKDNEFKILYDSERKFNDFVQDSKSGYYDESSRLMQLLKDNGIQY